MMYVFILCNLLAFAAGPALQGIISKATPPNEQGELMGSLQSVAAWEVDGAMVARFAPLES
jgi:DHA1 family tetracycline resistance protein-like MFS transporter